MSNMESYRETIEIDSSPEPEPISARGRGQPLASTPNGRQPRRTEDVVHRVSLTEAHESQITSRFSFGQQTAIPFGFQATPVPLGQSKVLQSEWNPPSAPGVVAYNHDKPPTTPPFTFTSVGPPPNFAFGHPYGQPAAPGVAFPPSQASFTVPRADPLPSQAPTILTTPAQMRTPSVLPRPAVSQQGISGGLPEAYDRVVEWVEKSGKISDHALNNGQHHTVNAGAPSHDNMSGNHLAAPRPPMLPPPKPLPLSSDALHALQSQATTAFKSVSQHPNENIGNRIASSPASLPTGPSKNEGNDDEVQFPYTLEHSILCTIQNLLEGALFDFAKRMVPNLLEQQQWESAEQGELNGWLKALKKSKNGVLDAFRTIQATLTYPLFVQVLDRLIELRHVAVHRGKVKRHGLKRFLPDAIQLVLCLRDYDRHKKLRMIEWGVWQPDKVNLEAELARSVSEFVNMDIPDRETFFRGSEMCGTWEVPGARRRILFPPLDGGRQPTRESALPAPDSGRKPRSKKRARSENPEAVRQTDPIITGATRRQKGSRKRVLSRSPEALPSDNHQSKRLKMMKTKMEATANKDIVDLTGDEGKENIKLNVPISNSGTIIDLTEDD